MTFRVRCSGRGSDEPPDVAPYNFGINQPWYGAHKDKDTHRIALSDWGSYDDPEGFGTATNTEEGGPTSLSNGDIQAGDGV